MKKTSLVLAFFSLFLAVQTFAAESKVRRFEAKGEVVTVDPIYSKITIKHAAIKDFAGDETTEFFVASPDLVKDLTKRDLVDFEIVDTKGDAKIEKIRKTGVAPAEEDLKLGQAVQDTLEGAGEVVKGVTEPIPPVNQLTSATVDATTNVTGAVLKDADADVKKSF